MTAITDAQQTDELVAFTQWDTNLKWVFCKLSSDSFHALIFFGWQLTVEIHDLGLYGVNHYVIWLQQSFS